ncbi:hypothetical protein ACWDHW_33330 [Streptomyces melanosporofaciens]
MKQHRGRSIATRAGPLAFRATRRVLLLCVMPTPPVLAVRLCFASTPTP